MGGTPYFFTGVTGCAKGRLVDDTPPLFIYPCLSPPDFIEGKLYISVHYCCRIKAATVERLCLWLKAY